jgi:hypothetical protein
MQRRESVGKFLLQVEVGIRACRQPTLAVRRVLVVGYIAKKPEYSMAASVKARKWKLCSKKIREAKAQLLREISERHYQVGAQTLP